MRKIVIAAAVIFLIAAGCNKTTGNQYGADNSSGNVAINGASNGTASDNNSGNSSANSSNDSGKGNSADQNLTTYQSPAGFSIKYQMGDKTYAQADKVPLTSLQSYYAAHKQVDFISIYFPAQLLPQTNFDDAAVNISVVSAARCTAPQSQAKVSSQVINGIKFAKYDFTGAAAGNLYESTVLQNEHSGKCYTIEKIVHSSNISNFDPSQGISVFDHGAVSVLTDPIMDSFAFTTGSVTNTTIH